MSLHDIEQCVGCKHPRYQHRPYRGPFIAGTPHDRGHCREQGCGCKHFRDPFLQTKFSK